MKRKIFGIPLYLILICVAAFFFRKQLGGLLTTLKEKFASKSTSTAS
ncbi:MAG: hypothetical protein QM791_02925 [Ferruginibacter sp.]